MLTKLHSRSILRLLRYHEVENAESEISDFLRSEVTYCGEMVYLDNG